jgi:hypothetical protein
MSNPIDTSIIARTISNPQSAVALITLVVNIGIVVLSAVANFIWFHNRKVNQREYDSECEFYKLTVLSSLSSLTSFASNLKIQFDSLRSKSRTKQGTKADIRKIVEAHISEIDKQLSAFNYNILPIIKGYSIELSGKIEKFAEEFYDQTTDVFSKFDRKDITSESEQRLIQKFSGEMTKFITNAFQNVRQHRPCSK